VGIQAENQFGVMCAAQSPNDRQTVGVVEADEKSDKSDKSDNWKGKLIKTKTYEASFGFLLVVGVRCTVGQAAVSESTADGTRRGTVSVLNVAKVVIGFQAQDERGYGSLGNLML